MDAPTFALLIDRYGLEGARYAFERMIAQLVRLERADGLQVEVRQGDGGLDVISGSTVGALDVWQAKFFYPRFELRHRGTVSSSLSSAAHTAYSGGGTLRRWTLCIPTDLDVDNSRWWNELKARNSAIELDLWGFTALASKLQSVAGRDVRYAFFELGRPDDGMRVSPPDTVATTDGREVGVAPAAGMSAVPTYVPRDIDDELDHALGRHGFVVLLGDSAAGKSRTMFEAARRGLGDYEIAVPDPSRLESLCARLARLRSLDNNSRLLLWLDDIDEYLRPGGLGVATINGLRQDGVRILATIRRERSQEIMQAGGAAAAVLDEAHHVRLYSRPSETEARAFSARHPGRRLAGEGIGAHFVAARRLQTRYRNASDDAVALTRIIIDWRRSTGARWIPAQTAAQALPFLGSDRFAAALAEAETDQAPGDAIVLREAARLTTPDFLVEYDDRTTAGHRRRDIDLSHWETFLAVADSEVSAAIAQAALRRRQPQVASRALEAARASDVAGIRAWATVQLGIGCARRDPEQATELWLEALDQEDAASVAWAAHLLIDQAEEQREELDSEIVDRLRTAVLGAHTEGIPRGELAVILSALAVQRGDLDTLAELYQTTNETSAAEVALSYSRALVADGQLSKAKETLKASLEHAYATTRAQSLVLLAQLYSDGNHDPDEVADAIEEAFGLAGMAIADDIMELERKWDDRGRLRDVYRRLAEGGNREARLYLFAYGLSDRDPWA